MGHQPSVGAAALRRLLALARDLLQAPDPKSVLELAGKAIQDLLAADEALLLVVLGDQEYSAEIGTFAFSQPAGHETMLSRYARQAIHDQTLILLPEVSGDWSRQPDHRHADAMASVLAFPFAPPKPVGVVAALWYRRGAHHQLGRHVSTLRYIGELTEAALGNVAFKWELEGRVRDQTKQIAKAARQHARELQQSEREQAELHRISVTDVMTGLLNRRGFFLHGEQSFNVARRQRAPSAVIYADLDGLKEVNDRFGHDVGDSMIRDFGRALRESFRVSDVVARLGGDEFAAFTLDSSRPEVIPGRIRENVDRLCRRDSPPYSISFSVGIAQCDPSSDLTLSDYIALADKKMYLQKGERYL